MIKNVIFDIDGTLANTSTDIINSFNYSLKKNGFKKKINFQEFKKAANNGSLSLIKKIIRRKNVYLKKINNDFLEQYKDNICVKSKLKKGVIPFLRFCKKNKIKCFISTNKLEHNAKLLLKKFKINNYFLFVAGSDTFKYRKPNFLHLEQLRKKFGFLKNETIFIGDTEIDSLLATKFKIKFILFKNGYTNVDPKQMNFDISVSNYSKLQSYIENFYKYKKSK
jgi:phosphoglycolate phosphatase